MAQKKPLAERVVAGAEAAEHLWPRAAARPTTRLTACRSSSHLPPHRQPGSCCSPLKRHEPSGKAAPRLRRQANPLFTKAATHSRRRR